MLDGSSYFAGYRIGGREVRIFDTNGCQRTTFMMPGPIVTPGALGPYVFVFHTESGTVAIGAPSGNIRQW